MEDNRVNCYKCHFFFVTWEPSLPYGCRAMGFKTKQLPSIVVHRSSGKPCQLFQEKETGPGKSR